MTKTTLFRNNKPSTDGKSSIKYRIKLAALKLGIDQFIGISPFFPTEEYAVAAPSVRERGDDDFSRIFYDYNGDGVVHKWGHYMPIYSKLFEPFRKRSRSGRAIRFLEIGVAKGGSLDMWRQYFGNEAVIFGIDIDPACADFNGKNAEVRIGSQADPAFLLSVAQEMVV